ncbi:hypothetical protein ACN20G_36790 (plasmid) [Streptomyces sp. BI20]|uniref:hypothetical protein n=1 Tax=Streptomyces sp. BI20 TaxID=3403460 RepID=UPI003C781729
MSKAEAAAVRAVEAAWPAELVELLPRYRPPVLRDAILAALGTRTPEQLAARIARRWDAHGYARDLHSAEGKGIGSPVGVAVGLVREPADCPDLACEDGFMVDSGLPCGTCAQRRADRKTAHRRDRVASSGAEAGTVPGPRTSAPPVAPAPSGGRRWQCMLCPTSGEGRPPADHMCDTCRAEDLADQARVEADAETRARAEETAQAEWIAKQRDERALLEPVWDVILADAYAEHSDRQAPEEVQAARRAAEDADIEAARTRFLAAHPELAGYRQPAEAPF